MGIRTGMFTKLSNNKDVNKLQDSDSAQLFQKQQNLPQKKILTHNIARILIDITTRWHLIQYLLICESSDSPIFNERN